MQALTIVNRVVEDVDLGREALAIARRLAAGPTQAYAATKAVWRIESEEGIRSAKSRLYDLSMPVFETDDARTALRNATEAVEAGRPFPAATFTGR
jgi:hypothetical protein